ncbi:hypothetical protein TraAM80_00897 [Trypanosoma rangeli]|uniref:Uncharacterized protein n=1 Tax=Trypanosoma rangeli TaxID=5698 RepID=A0A3R7N1U4_TRYRA|nr:uncharacterized protein TraAM80_00897 [Trypanosoma rangeli]RNF11451.1 hypothetical protein TraAM80_00897 [Trypanosoma rangeli]|eukprot:RNF11451.1 hypothetical protein TraAM80_00897 [Trypanosoma rangeli]
MGCTSSSRNFETDSEQRGNLLERGKERVPVSAVSETSPRGSKGRANDVYDAVTVAVTATSRESTVFTDYRGVELHMTNSTPAKTNTVCRWLDSILEIRERNGGFFFDQKSEASSGSHGGILIDTDSTSLTMVQEGNISFPNRLNVSMCAPGAPCSVRRVGKIRTTAKSSEYPQEPSKLLAELHNKEKMPVVGRLGTPENTMTISVFSPVGDLQHT